MTLKESRELTGLGPAQFAAKYHIPYRSYYNWESGTRKPPIYLLELLERVVKDDYRTKKRMP